MKTNYYFVHEVRNVLFAHPVSPRLASQFNRTGSITLASPEELQNLAGRKNKSLHLVGEPSVRPYLARRASA